MNIDLTRLTEKDSLLWCVAFTGVCILVGLGKLQPETLTYLLFAIGGAVASQKSEPIGSKKEPNA